MEPKQPRYPLAGWTGEHDWNNFVEHPDLPKKKDPQAPRKEWSGNFESFTMIFLFGVGFCLLVCFDTLEGFDSENMGPVFFPERI